MIKKAIVTGATGFIGGALTHRLLSDGVKVYGVDISEEKLSKWKQFENFIPVVADFSQYEKLHGLIFDDGVDIFYHFAWQGVFGDAFKDYALQLNNAKYCCEALKQAKQIGCKKFVLAGTYNEYEIRNFLASDYFEPRYTCIYSAAKTAAELMCKTLAYNLEIEYSAGLICMTYGENNKSEMLTNVVIRQLIQGISPQLIRGDNLYDMIYIDDIADAFIAIGEKGRDLKSYYVGHRKLKTFKELLSEVRDILAPNVELQFGAYHDTVNMDYSLIDLDALYRDTGFECHADFRESILKTAEWLKRQED